MKAFGIAGTLALGIALAAAVAEARPASPAQPASATRAGAHVDPKAPCFRWPAVDMDEDGVFDRVDHCVNTPKGCIVDQYGCETDADGDGVCDGLDQCPDTPKGTRVDKKGCAKDAHPAAEKTPERVAPPAEPPRPATPPANPMERELIETGRIRLENIYFETASSRLLPESAESLNEAGQTLQKYPTLRIEIEGHTDTRGWARYNMRLSQARAEAVRAYLLDHFQLAPGNVSARGYGEKRPETEERNDEELLRNRRVVLRVLNPEVLPRGITIDKGVKP